MRILKRIGRYFELLASRSKQFFILRYIYYRCGGRDVIKLYNSYEKENTPLLSASPIWTCWWQGEDNMPAVVKICYESMKRCAGTHPVILITKDNYSKYLDIPSFILEKKQQGIIDLTHFSDIIRMLLLKQQGGIWMDSTLLIPSGQIDDIIKPGMDFWTCRHVTPYLNVARGGWVSFFVAAGKGHLIPSIIADLHIAYWKKCDKLVDYLLLDYAFAVATKWCSAAKGIIAKLPITEMGPLGKRLNAPWTAENWNEACHRYHFHKITYKIPLETHTASGKLTNYGFLINSFLNDCLFESHIASDK